MNKELKAYEKYYEDENYKKFSPIISKYCVGYHIYPPRKDLYQMKDYYVFGINANNFIEPDECPENHKEKYIEDLKDIHMENLAEIFLDRRDHMDMEYFIELNNLLKDAGAKRVWIHPSEKWNKKTNMSEPVQSIREWLIVIEC